MRNPLHLPLRHMTADAVVRRLLLPSYGHVKPAASLAVTAEATGAEVRRSFGRARLPVRIVTRQATQLAAARPIARAPFHRLVMFEQVALLRFRWARFRRQAENCESTDQRRTRTKIAVLPARQENARVACLMALNADILRQPGRQPCGIHDR